MKTITATLTLLAALAVGRQPSPEFLNALALTESLGDPKAVGRTGDLGLFQFTRPAWVETTSIREEAGLPVYPFESGSLDPIVARDYAATYLSHLIARLDDSGRPVNPESVWLAWTMGFNGARKVGFDSRKAPASKRRGFLRLSHHLGGAPVVR